VRDGVRMEVRRATQDDVDALAALLTDPGFPSERDAIRARLAALGDDDAVLIAGRGFIALHRVPRFAEGGAAARITALAVAQHARREGVGRALLSAAERVAVDWGCDLLEVTTGRRTERIPAHALYERFGFTDQTAHSVRYRKAIT
jgi:GNAT superfamily N-acetyltransferase